MVDTVVEHSKFYHVLKPTSLTNQYTAIPIPNFGWNLV